MEPSIRAGDVLMVDRAQQRLVKDAIYIIRQNNLLYVKRVQRLYDGSVRISSDNKAYAEEVIPRKQGVQTAEAANAVAFLLSPRSSGINAQRIVVDAGMSINYFDREIIRGVMGEE